MKEFRQFLALSVRLTYQVSHRGCSMKTSFPPCWGQWEFQSLPIECGLACCTDTVFILRKPQSTSIIESSLKHCVCLSQGECTSSMVTRPQCSLPASAPQSAVPGNCRLISFQQLLRRSCRNIQSSQDVDELCQCKTIISVSPWWRKVQLYTWNQAGTSMSNISVSL